jgi:glyoxylase-like metal-dependent hydrolase (beta-lactamase superfamily II)
MRIGDLEVLPVHDGVLHVPITDPLLNMPPEAWEAHREFLTDDGTHLDLTLGGFLVRARERVVLVDCGVGRIDAAPWHGGAFLQSLAAYGVQPADVTDVLLTHLHFDHVGWATQQGQIVFPNATYRCSDRDWAHFVGSDEGATKKLTPLTERMIFWSESGTVLPGLDVLTAPGHTPGSTMIVLSSGTERAILLGDVVQCPVALLDDEWKGIADVDPALAQRTRNALAREIEGNGVPVAGAHFPGMQFGRLLRGESGRKWVTL